MNILLFEQFLMRYPNILKTFKDLPPLYLKLDLPQVKSKRHNFYIENHKIISSDLKAHILYDFLITNENEFIIGSQHYKMSNKSNIIKTCGELKINDNGKICYLNNESGHYKPTKILLYKTYNLFKKEALTSNDIKVDYLY